jgi:predicted RNase H-like HicB family nuclease
VCGCFMAIEGLASAKGGAILLAVPMTLTVECEQEFEGRWFAEVPQLPGVHGYGSTRDAATEQALLLAYRMLEDESRLGITRSEADALYGRQSERGSSIAPPPAS